MLCMPCASVLWTGKYPIWQMKSAANKMQQDKSIFMSMMWTPTKMAKENWAQQDLKGWIQDFGWGPIINCCYENVHNGRYIITARKRSLRQGNIFTGICLCTEKGGGLPDRDPPVQRPTPLDRDPLDRETSLDRDPLWQRPPGQRDPLDRDWWLFFSQLQRNLLEAFIDRRSSLKRNYSGKD